MYFKLHKAIQLFQDTSKHKNIHSLDFVNLVKKA